MKKLALLMFGCASMATLSLARADAPASLDGLDEFHHIRTALSPHLCLQPRGGATTDTIVELAECQAGALAQDWIFLPRTGGRIILNRLSGKCLYNDAPLPLRNRGREITQQTCGDSNTLWDVFSPAPGTTSLVSRVGFQDTHFCLDVPDANAFGGATMWMFGCNRTPAQQWIIN